MIALIVKYGNLPQKKLEKPNNGTIKMDIQRHRTKTNKTQEHNTENSKDEQQRPPTKNRG